MYHPKFEENSFILDGIQNTQPKQIVDYFLKNKSHLANSTPVRTREFYTEKFWEKEILKYRDDFSCNRCVRFSLLDQQQVVGMITFDQIMRGAFNACFLGYSIDKDYQCRGLATKFIKLSLDWVIKENGLNRVMANYRPENIASHCVLKKLGFEREGYARKYLKLNGEWVDHILTSYVA